MSKTVISNNLINKKANLSVSLLFLHFSINNSRSLLDEGCYFFELIIATTKLNNLSIIITVSYVVIPTLHNFVMK